MFNYFCKTLKDKLFEIFQKNYASHQRRTDCKDDDRIDDVEARILLLLYVVNSIDSGGILYVGNNIDSAYDESSLLGLIDFVIKWGCFYGWYDYAIELSEECKSYLNKQLSEEIYDIEYFIHYAVFQGEKCVMQVFDGNCIGIDKSIKIPDWLMEECERNEVWIHIEDKIDMNRY